MPNTMRTGTQYWQDMKNICPIIRRSKVKYSQVWPLSIVSAYKHSLSENPTWCITYLCTNARRRSFFLTSLTSVIVDGGVKQSHWMVLAFCRLCSLCCSATSDRSSYLPTLISRDLNKTLLQIDLFWNANAMYMNIFWGKFHRL